MFLVLLWPEPKALCSLLNFQRERVVEEMPGGSQESEWFMSAGMLGEDNSMLKSESPAVSSDLLLRQITKWLRRRRGEPPFKTNHFLCIPTWCVYHDTQAWCFFGRKKKGNRSVLSWGSVAIRWPSFFMKFSDQLAWSRNYCHFFVIFPVFLFFISSFWCEIMFCEWKTSAKKQLKDENMFNWCEPSLSTNSLWVNLSWPVSFLLSFPLDVNKNCPLTIECHI